MPKRNQTRYIVVLPQRSDYDIPPEVSDPEKGLNIGHTRSVEKPESVYQHGGKFHPAVTAALQRYGALLLTADADYMSGIRVRLAAPQAESRSVQLIGEAGHVEPDSAEVRVPDQGELFRVVVKRNTPWSEPTTSFAYPK
jgi:hypothetical protein